MQSQRHAEVYGWAQRISEHLLPRTRAYHEIWLDDEPVAGGEIESEPVYGETYLPRKFKIAVAVPPHNDVDVYTNDLGFVAIGTDRLEGFNVLAGGGMGATHGDRTTFPRLADALGFVRPDQVLAVARAVLTTQRDFGNRISRRHARLKYTIERIGLDSFHTEVERRAGLTFEPARPVVFTDQGDRYGWVDGVDGRGHLTLYIENGRIADQPGTQLMNRLFRENLTEAAILETLNELFGRYAAERLDGETFGNYSIRSGLVAEVRNPAEDFHDPA